MQKVTLINSETGASFPVTPAGSELKNPNQWRRVEENGDTIVLKNLQSRPRAWLVPEVFSTDPEEVLRGIRESVLPGGRTFDPSRMASVEETFNFKIEDIDNKATAQIVDLSKTTVEVQTNSRTASFLV